MLTFFLCPFFSSVIMSKNWYITLYNIRSQDLRIDQLCCLFFFLVQVLLLLCLFLCSRNSLPSVFKNQLLWTYIFKNRINSPVWFFRGQSFIDNCTSFFYKSMYKGWIFFILVQGAFEAWCWRRMFFHRKEITVNHQCCTLFMRDVLKAEVYKFQFREGDTLQNI